MMLTNFAQDDNFVVGVSEPQVLRLRSSMVPTNFAQDGNFVVGVSEQLRSG
jgi:hypothetical protein